MSEVKLDERLNAVANFVRSGSTVADIGTDHAFLPVCLIQRGICDKAIACDINPLPLERARNTIEHYGLNDKIELRLSDGLSEINANECENIVIAGMGGELIASILDSCEWVKSTEYNLILNPMTKSEKLRGYLLSHGFEIVKETAVISNNKHYSVINSKFSGKIITDIPLEYLYCGELLNDRSSVAKQYKEMTANRLLKRLNGLIASDGREDEISILKNVISEILK